MLDFSRKFGKVICVILYALFAYLCAKGIWIPLAALVLLHFSEYFIAAMNVAKKNGISQITAFVNCLAFGFTWWLPIKENKDTYTK